MRREIPGVPPTEDPCGADLAGCAGTAVLPATVSGPASGAARVSGMTSWARDSRAGWASASGSFPRGSCPAAASRARLSSCDGSRTAHPAPQPTDSRQSPDNPQTQTDTQTRPPDRPTATYPDRQTDHDIHTEPDTQTGRSVAR